MRERGERREKREEGERKEKEEREKEKKEESRKREKEEKREKEKEIREHYELSMKKGTNFPLIVLLPMDELLIKEQWHQQWKEERILHEDLFIKQQGDQQWEDKIMIKQDTNIEIYAHELACLPIPNKPMGDQSHIYNLVVCLSNIPFLFFEHFISNLKLFNDLCRWVFDPGGRPPKSLIIRDWLFSRIQISF